MFKNKTYDILKFTCQIVLPAVGTLYYALAGIWGFPYADHVVGTIAAVTTCLGTVLGVSNARYKKAETADEVKEEPEG